MLDVVCCYAYPMTTNEKSTIAVYQNERGAIALSVDTDEDTIWASQKQIAELFDVNIPTINEHLNNIYATDELEEDPTIRKFRIVQKEGSRDVTRDIKHYNLDVIISVGYRVSSRNATHFRRWATETLKAYIVEGFAINPTLIKKNQSRFIQAMEEMKQLAADAHYVGSSQVADLSVQFAKTWFSLDAYDKSELPTTGNVRKAVDLKASELHKDLKKLKTQLIAEGEATDLFAQEKNAGSFEGIFGNVFQSFGGQDVYPTLEEKAANLLYFVVKNHVFNDGNKRSGAYSFIWFLKEVELLNTQEISPQALTALTLLVAESDPKDKDRTIGLILLMLGVEKTN